MIQRRKQAHKMLFRRLAKIAPSKERQDVKSEVEQHLKLLPKKVKRSPNRSSEGLPLSRPKRPPVN
jgi:hypothetical protein